MPIRRLAGVCVTLCLLLALLLCRVYWIAGDTVYAASAGRQALRELTLPTLRGNFYDRAGRPMTGTVQRWYALCVPGMTDYAALFPHVVYEWQGELYEKRNAAAPFLVEVRYDLTNLGVLTFGDAARTLPLPIAEHLLGTLDGEGHGISGLEKAYDALLAAAGEKRSILYATNAQGTLLQGTAPVVQTTAEGTGLGVKLTLDANLQRLCEGIADEMLPRGCIVVMDTATGELLACVSRPGFDPRNLAKSIAADDTSLLDRPLCAFSVGSVFKVVAAAVACQNGLDWFTHDCAGSVEVDGQNYRCARGKAHGLVNLRGALAESCNCYFIELGQRLGGATLLRAAQAFGFGAPTTLAPGFAAAAGTLPEETALGSTGQQAIFSFGQGALTATPLQVTAMMNAVADGGQLRAPRLVAGVVDETGHVTDKTLTPEPTCACDADTARLLRSMLETVVEEGIGTDAKPESGTAAGKTGTAQTGQFEETGEELLNYWFSGFAPTEAPRYTVTVLQDAILEPQTTSAAIFAKIIDALHGFEAQEPGK